MGDNIELAMTKEKIPATNTAEENISSIDVNAGDEMIEIGISTTENQCITPSDVVINNSTGETGGMASPILENGTKDQGKVEENGVEMDGLSTENGVNMEGNETQDQGDAIIEENCITETVVVDHQAGDHDIQKNVEEIEAIDDITSEKNSNDLSMNTASPIIEPVELGSPKRPTDVLHQVKWVPYSSKETAAFGTVTPIVTQNENGPCPLLALINVLLLRGQAKLDNNVEAISAQALLNILRDCIMRLTPQELSNQADYQRNVADALASLPKLLTGIDVNVRFTGVDQFEYTPDCLVFDLLNIPLYHGWLVEPERGPLADAIGQLTYNQLAEFIIELGTDQNRAIAATMAEDFLETTASQLTYRGICELNATLNDGALCVFFRNNHFSTLIKHEDELFLLVTDQGFLHEPRVVWESLNSVDGDSRFVDIEFRSVPPKVAPVVAIEGVAPLPPDASPQEQIDHDLMVALSMEEQERAAVDVRSFADLTAGQDGNVSIEERDRRLALKLQEEENNLAAPEQQGSPSAGATTSGMQQRHSPDSATASGGRTSGSKKDKCNIL